MGGTGIHADENRNVRHGARPRPGAAGRSGLSGIKTAVAVASACLWLSASAFAQTASQITPPTFRPPPGPDTAGVSIPEGKGLEAPAGAEKLQVKLAAVHIEGGLPDMADATRKITAGLSRRTVTAAQIFVAARQLEAEYARAGYALVRVVLPAQKLGNGATLRLIVVDGFLEKIDTGNLPERIRGRVEAALAPLVGQKGIKLSAIERKLLVTIRAVHNRRLLRDDGRVAYLDSTLRRQPILGEYHLDIPERGQRPARRLESPCARAQSPSARKSRVTAGQHFV